MKELEEGKIGGRTQSKIMQIIHHAMTTNVDNNKMQDVENFRNKNPSFFSFLPFF